MRCEQQSRILVQRERGSWWPILYANDSRVPLLQTTRQTAGKKQNKHRDHNGEKRKSAHVLNSASQGVWGVFRRNVVDLIHATKFDQLTPHVPLTGRLALVDVPGANKLFALLEDSISGIRCNASQRNPFLASITCPMWRTALECWGKAPYFAKKGPPSA